MMAKKKRSNRKKKWIVPFKGRSSIAPRGSFGMIKGRLPTLFPDRYRCKLKYASTFEVTATNTGVASTYVWRANDLADPYVGVGDIVPKGFYMLCNLFNHFTVIGSKITVRNVNLTGANGNQSLWGISLTDSGNRIAGKTWQDIVTDENVTKYGCAGSAGYGITGYNSQRSLGFSLKKFFNLDKKSKPSEARFQCSATTSPTEQAYFEVWNISFGGLAAQETHFTVQIDYIVECHEPISLSMTNLDAGVVENTVGGLIVEVPGIGTQYADGEHDCSS